MIFVYSARIVIGHSPMLRWIVQTIRLTSVIMRCFSRKPRCSSHSAVLIAHLRHDVGSSVHVTWLSGRCGALRCFIIFSFALKSFRAPFEQPKKISRKISENFSLTGHASEVSKAAMLMNTHERILERKKKKIQGKRRNFVECKARTEVKHGIVVLIANLRHA